MDTVWSLPVPANWLWGHLYVSVLPISSTNRKTGMERMRGKGFTNKTNNRRAKNKSQQNHVFWLETRVPHPSTVTISLTSIADAGQTHMQGATFIHKCSGCTVWEWLVWDTPLRSQLTASKLWGGKHITNWACKKHGHHSDLAASKPAAGKASWVQPLPPLFILVSSNSPDFKDFW